MAATVDQFGKAVVASGVMTADEVKAIWATLPGDRRPKDGDHFAQFLVEQGKLTAFQAQELLAGRGARLVMGEYSLLAKIGEGGMGQVFKAQHRRMNRVVALKVMSAAAMKDEAAIKRFQREVHAAARLEHPNIVTAYDSGEAGNVKYLVMQFVDGGDLSDLVKKNGPLEVERAVDYVLQAARGLAFAHGEGVIHRDIKPANLLLDKKGVVKILDMGLARIEGGDGLTATEQVMGTVDYMSPEQAGDTKHVDGRADIYSLGCTLWYLLTGKRAYDGDTMIQRLMKHRTDPLPSLVKVRDDAPWSLEQTFHKMIAKLPQERFQSMDEVVAALEPFASGGGSRSGRGSSIGLDGGSQNAELASFLNSVGPTVKSQTKSAPSTTNAELEATEQFNAADTDPKSEIVPTAKKAAKPLAKGSGGRPSMTNKNLILAGAGGGMLLVLLGVWFLFRGDAEPVASVPSVSPSGTVPSGTKPAGSPPLPVAGAPGYALEFDGQGHLHSERFDDQFLEPPLTIEGLFKLTANQGAGQHPLLWFERQLGLLVNSAGDWAILEYGNHQLTTEPYFRFQTDSVIEPNRTVHLAAVWTPGRLLLFNDGRLTASQAMLPTTARIVLSRFYSGKFSGVVDEIHVSRAARYEQDFTPVSRFEPDAKTLALYHCDDGVGGLLADASPNRMHGTIQGGKWIKSSLVAPPQAASPTSFFTGTTAPAAPSFTPPVATVGTPAVPSPAVSADSALSFDGQTGEIIIPNLQRDGGPYTLECRIRDFGSKITSIMRVNGRAPIQLHLANQMPHGAERNADDKIGRDLTGPALSPDRWTHLAYVVDASESRLYVDGKLAKKQAGPPAIAATAKFSGTWIGSERLGGFSGSFGGKIDEIRVSSTARYTNDFEPDGRFSPDANTLALYHCDEGSGNVLNDSSGKGCHGQITGVKWVNDAGSSIPPTSSPLIAGPTVDLMPLVRIDQPKASGPWKRDAQGIVIPEGGYPRTQIDYAVSDAYELHIEAVPLSGAKSLILGLSRAGKRFWIPVSGWNQAHTKLEPMPTTGTGQTESKSLRLIDNRPVTLVCTVRRDGVKLVGDGLTLIDWHGDTTSLSPEWSSWVLPEPEKLALGSWEGSIRVTRLELRPLTPSTAQPRSGSPTIARSGSVLSSPPTALGEVDLLAGLNTARDAVVGTFTLSGGLQPTSKTTNSRIYLPAVVPAEYDLTISVSRTAQTGIALMVGFPWNGCQGSVVIDGYGPPSSGLEMIDGKSAHQNGTLSRGERITIGAPHEIVVRVRNDGVAAACDGATLFDWKGKPEQLSTHAMWDVPRKDRFFIGFQGPYVVHSARLKPVKTGAVDLPNDVLNADGWISLFDGRTLEGWEVVGDGGWSAEAGVLKAAGTGKGWIGTTRTFRDYELELEYRIQPVGNGGIALRAWKDGGVSAKPYFEVQIIDDQARPTPFPTGSITDNVPAKPDFTVPVGPWTKVFVRLAGKHVNVAFNGTTTVDADLPIERSEGMIGLQVWDRPVEYRNIRVRELGNR